MKSKSASFILVFIAVCLSSCTFSNEFAVEPEKAYKNFRRHQSWSVNAQSLNSWLTSAKGSAEYTQFPYVATEAIKKEVNNIVRQQMIDHYVVTYLKVKSSRHKKIDYTSLSNNWKLEYYQKKIYLSDESILYECVPRARLYHSVLMKDKETEINNLKELVLQLKRHGATQINSGWWDRNLMVKAGLLEGVGRRNQAKKTK